MALAKYGLLSTAGLFVWRAVTRENSLELITFFISILLYFLRVLFEVATTTQSMPSSAVCPYCKGIDIASLVLCLIVLVIYVPLLYQVQKSFGWVRICTCFSENYNHEKTGHV